MVHTEVCFILVCICYTMLALSDWYVIYLPRLQVYPHVHFYDCTYHNAGRRMMQMPASHNTFSKPSNSQITKL